MAVRKVPAVTIDVTDDGEVYTVTALPWPTIESTGQPFVARLRHFRPTRDLRGLAIAYPSGPWTTDRLGRFVKDLMKTYPKVSA